MNKHEGFQTNVLSPEGKKHIEEITKEFDVLLHRLAKCNHGRYGALMVTHLEIACTFAKKSVSTLPQFHAVQRPELPEPVTGFSRHISGGTVYALKDFYELMKKGAIRGSDGIASYMVAHEKTGEMLVSDLDLDLPKLRKQLDEDPNWKPTFGRLLFIGVCWFNN